MDLRWTPKPEVADQLEAELAGLSKALAHPARLRILREVLAQGPCSCGHLTSALPLAQSTVSQHLKVLKQAGILEVEAGSGQGSYRLNPQALIRYRTLVATLTAQAPVTPQASS